MDINKRLLEIIMSDPDFFEDLLKALEEPIED